MKKRNVAKEEKKRGAYRVDTRLTLRTTCTLTKEILMNPKGAYHDKSFQK